jgi:PAS domain S-box-containing protein
MRSPEELQREVDARKQAEDALHQANAELRRQFDARHATEERFRLLVEGTKDHAIYMLDPAGRVASWNPGAERIKGYRADEIVGQHFSGFYPPDAIQEGKPQRELLMAAAQGRYEEEGWRLRKDGSRFWANVVITALRDEAGNLRGYSKITRDMTERRQA